LIEILDKKKKRKKEILEAISIIKKYNSIEIAKEKAREIVEKSWKDVEKLFPFNKAREQLKELIYFLVERKL
jgi:geranylgeranyl pyrophosphate synthase